MRNVQINFAETIFEPFWDSGESYPDNKKYSVLSEYKIYYSSNAVARISPMWSGVNVDIESQQDNEASVVIERDCNLEIEEYDIFRLFASMPSSIHLIVICTIDGKDERVLDTNGNDTTGEYNGTISGKFITHIRTEFSMSGTRPSTATLYWFGLSNSKRQIEIDNKVSPYTADWQGCFEENPVIKPRIGIYFGDVELEALREKVKKEPFKTMFDKMRQQAIDALKLNPESEIDTYLSKGDRRWERDRDMKRHPLNEPMECLAFVGIVDENLEMLKMACRMALSAAHHTYWCEGILGVFPGATWHHRSFTEEVMCSACALVLDWAGSLLTWHGRNIIYDAIIMKGLPRIEADFKTMQYIREMNQGIVFSTGRITALLALAAEYPRYNSWLKDAEKDLHEMIDNYVLNDGGTLEGPGYWTYTFSNILPVIYMLARYSGKTLPQYATKSLIRTGDYALGMMSESADSTFYLPVNDAHMRRYSPIISACYTQISNREEWMKIYSRTMANSEVEPNKNFIIIAPEPQTDNGGPIMKCGVTALMDIGQVGYVSECEGIGRIKLHLCSGPIYFAHYHADKGSFIIEAGGEQLAIDRGVCQYDNPYVSLITKPYVHNLFMPEAETGYSYVQPNDTKGGSVTFAEYIDGVLLYTSDNEPAWEKGIYKHNYRRVFSLDPQLYIFNDDVEYIKETISSFHLNTLGNIIDEDGVWVINGEKACLRVIPINWEPEKSTFGIDGCNGEGEDVNQLRLYTNKAQVHNVITVVEVLPYKNSGRVNVLENGLLFDDKEIIINISGNEVSIDTGSKVYSAVEGTWRIYSN
jgi:hypothetical protein